MTGELDCSFGIGLPKIKQGHRAVSLNPEAAQLLAELRNRTEANALGLSLRLLFTRHLPSQEPPAGRPYAASHVDHESQRCLERTGIPPMPFHFLRHTAASLMLAGGYEIPIVSRILGHSTPAITAIIYAHGVPGREREAVQALRFHRRGAGVA